MSSVWLVTNNSWRAVLHWPNPTTYKKESGTPNSITRSKINGSWSLQKGTISIFNTNGVGANSAAVTSAMAVKTSAAAAAHFGRNKTWEGYKCSRLASTTSKMDCFRRITTKLSNCFLSCLMDEWTTGTSLRTTKVYYTIHLYRQPTVQQHATNDFNVIGARKSVSERMIYRTSRVRMAVVWREFVNWQSFRRKQLHTVRCKILFALIWNATSRRILPATFLTVRTYPP